ncbi:PAS domain S-box protein [Scytonema sp. UIC 10036]|uniref:sensor histidine kinase n=1 Tax=Scytonema sp. UIC 10036 TaxID=2304196 RepID=UPI0012DA19B1|nr:HAMP domain-containing sensor histidine kinase [Scytonema sp. UIC 10036]MUG97838.1 PAS domain S-box protein [Scytonema sp. UIC 10036]
MTAGNYISGKLNSKVTQQIEELAQSRNTNTRKQVSRKINQCSQIQKELRSHEQLFRDTFDCAPVGMAHVGLDGKWLLVNHKLCDIVGYTQQQLESQACWDITYPEDLKAEQEYFHQMLACEIQTYSMEKRYIHKNGSCVWTDINVSLVLESNGAPKYFIYVVNDISSHKQAEVKFQQSLQEEKDFSEQRARFVCMVSHELRIPLHLISFSTSLLKRHSHQWNQEKKLKYFDRIQTAVEHLSELMDNVLMIGRSEAGKLTYEPRAIDLQLFCYDLVTQLQMRHNSQHHLTFTSHGEGSTVYVDDKLLQPILTNLLDNAIKYSPNGSTVVLELSYADKEAIFQIKDRGVGIAATDLQRLFEPFYRGKNVGDIHGNGLGLAVVKKLVDLHRGQISVESDIGVGTTFTIAIPTDKSLGVEVLHPPIIRFRSTS